MDNVKTTLHKLEYNISMYRNHRYHTRCLLQWLRSYFVKNRCAWLRWMSSTPFSHMCTCPVWTARHVHMKIRLVKLSENAHYVWRALKACGPGCHFSSKAGQKKSQLFGQISSQPLQPWCNGFLCQNYWLPPPHYWFTSMWVQIQCQPVRPMQLWRIV
jgi:hypothetical protein